MIWSSRRILGTKGLRCPVRVRRLDVECGRPAKRYAQTCKGFDLGLITCCKNHARMLEDQGVELKVYRKKQ